MSKLLAIINSLAVVLAGVTVSLIGPSSVLADPRLSPDRFAEPFVIAVNVDCREAAEQVATETGGRVLSVRPDPSGACEITVLVQTEGSRPQRIVLVRPA